MSELEQQGSEKQDNSDVTELEEKNKQLTEQVADLESKISDKDEEIASLETGLEEAESKVEEIELAETEQREEEAEPEAEQAIASTDTESGDVPREWESALNSAYNYAEIMSMSKAGIYDQLVSEYGEAFPEEAAQYAIDNIEFDWNENALKSAKNYQDLMDMSHSAIY